MATGDVMRIGVLGGSGKHVSGLAYRPSSAGHEVVLGSRDPQRARSRADELSVRGPAGG